MTDELDRAAGRHPSARLPRAAVLPANEKDVERYVKDAARQFQWMRYHTHRSDFSPAGFPDETLIRPPRLIFAELKGATAYARKDHGLSADQARWIDLLGQIPGVEAYVWGPDQFDDIVRILR